MPRALITGIHGQDGRYLAKFLHTKNYEVYGLVHDARTDDSRVAREMPFVQLVRGNLTDVTSLIRACEEVQPDEVYNLGSQSAVDLSFTEPKATLDVTGFGPLNMLEALKSGSQAPQPSSSSRHQAVKCSVTPDRCLTPRLRSFILGARMRSQK